MSNDFKTYHFTISKQEVLDDNELKLVELIRLQVSREKLKGLKKEILSLNEFGELLKKAFHIKRTLFDLGLTISCLTGKTKKDPAPQAFGMPIMGGVNLPQIEVTTFDCAVLNCWLFWEQFLAVVHDELHLGDVDKLRYLWDAVKGGIQGLIQTAESYGEAIKCLKDLYDCPRP